MLIALDTETLGCDPRKETPIDKAKLWCITLAWRDPDSEAIQTQFLEAKYINHVRDDILENPDWKKVGTNILGYDRHVLANEGIHLKGIVGDTLVMSRLLNPDQRAGHGLKDWGERLGFKVKSYTELASRPRHSAGREYKRTHNRYDKWPIYIHPGPVWDIHWNSKPELIPLDQLWEEYPSRRQQVVDYAVQDAIMSLIVYEHLAKELEKTRW